MTVLLFICNGQLSHQILTQLRFLKEYRTMSEAESEKLPLSIRHELTEFLGTIDIYTLVNTMLR